MRETTTEKQLVRRLFEESYTLSNLETIGEIMHSDYLHHTTLGNLLHGREALRRSMIEHDSAFPAALAEVHMMLAESSEREMMFHLVRDGLIVEGWNIADRLSIAEQLGAVDYAGLPEGLRA